MNRNCMKPDFHRWHRCAWRNEVGLIPPGVTVGNSGGEPYPRVMAETNILDLVLSNVIRFLIEGGLPLQVVEEEGKLRYFAEGRGLDAGQIIASARLLGMKGLTPPANG
ncbi:hypothetical protein LDDCCGHA_0869 [Methylobacterium oxalidis]|nr:hypothetical protein LDDCCGHA_0869 [Methylobacterium oxalidis]